MLELIISKSVMTENCSPYKPTSLHYTAGIPASILLREGELHAKCDKEKRLRQVRRGKVVRRPASKQCWSELSCLIINHTA